MLAIVSAIRDVDLDHINFDRHNTHQQVCIQNLLRRGKGIAKDLRTNGYGASSLRGSFSTIQRFCYLIFQ